MFQSPEVCNKKKIWGKNMSNKSPQKIQGTILFMCVPGQFFGCCARSLRFPSTYWTRPWKDFPAFEGHLSVEVKKKMRTTFISSLWKPLNEHTVFLHIVYTFEASWSTLSATFTMDNRISVLCCRASVIKKEVTSLGPVQNNTIKTMTGCVIFNSFTT